MHVLLHFSRILVRLPCKVPEKPDISKGPPSTPLMAFGSSLDQEVGMEIESRELASIIIEHL